MLHKDPKLPGAILSEPLRKITITPRGKEVSLEQEMGVSISIPRNAVVKEEQLDLATSFSDSYQMPDGVESVSPAYIIETSKEIIELSGDIEVRLQHTANVETEEECRDLMVLRAALSPSLKGSASNAVHKFEKEEEIKAKFSLKYAVMKVKKLASSVFKVATRRKDKGNLCTDPSL